MNKEEILQSEIAVAFSQRFPFKRGQLFHVSNERGNARQAFKAKAIGIIPGVADFIYFDEDFNVATEIKAKGTRHLVSRIKMQMLWGKLWEEKGNFWRLCTTKEQALSCYDGDFKGMTVEQVEKLLKKTTTKTISF